MPRPITFDAPAFSAGDTFTVTVGIEDVVDLYTFSFDLAFDPGVVTPTDAVAGAFLGGSFFFAIFPDDPFGVPGTIQFISDTLTGQVPGVSGSGDLALVTFLALTGGDPGFALSNALLFDSAGGLIEADLPATIPEPVTLPLLALGLLALHRRRRAG